MLQFSRLAKFKLLHLQCQESQVRYTAMTSRTEDIYFPFFFLGVSNYSSRHDLEDRIHRHRSAIDIIETTKLLCNVNYVYARLVIPDHYCFHKIKVHQSFQNLLLELNTIEAVQTFQIIRKESIQCFASFVISRKVIFV